MLQDRVIESVCLLGSKWNVHSKPEKLRPSKDTIGT